MESLCAGHSGRTWLLNPSLWIDQLSHCSQKDLVLRHSFCIKALVTPHLLKGRLGQQQLTLKLRFVNPLTDNASLANSPLNETIFKKSDSLPELYFMEINFF